ncbi:MAG TPA: glycosyltransferase family 2 protein [Caulobacteraceae bacterium]
MFDLWRQGSAMSLDHPAKLLELCLFGLIVSGLLYGSLVYQIARAGYFARLCGPAAAPRRQLEAIYDRPAKALAILIPSYKEEPIVLAKTILSAALMECPRRRICVLLDDPPHGSASDVEALRASRKLVAELDASFFATAKPYILELQAFLRRSATPGIDTHAESRRVAGLYLQAARRVDELAAPFQGLPSPADRFLIEAILERCSADHRARARQLWIRPESAEQILREYRRLASLFEVRIESFERKRYVDLSHASNKAMNLNAYIGLLGKSYRETPSPEGLVLTACAVEDADLHVAGADYLLTLDADSMVRPDYALRLMAIMEADARIAVAQTPYSAFPNSASMVERIAGATTDLQYIVHQGFTAFHATYWVGANALLRYGALTDIQTWESERGRNVPVFIQDRTVIEDTGSTVDLIRRGWRLHNHPQRLAYSATPPDFGALVIQRRRWANGGLVILPDLVRYCLAGNGGRPAVGEALMRAHYLVAPAISNLGLLALLLVRFDSRFATLWLPLSAAPYYFVYGRDLKQAGYRAIDLFSVYALNLLLLPVNVAGVLASVRQLISGRKATFARTPKVEDRTSTPPIFIAFLLAAILYMGTGLFADLSEGLWTHAAFAGLNGVLFAFGFTVFLGWRNSMTDLAAAFRRPQAIPVSSPRLAAASPTPHQPQPETQRGRAPVAACLMAPDMCGGAVSPFNPQRTMAVSAALVPVSIRP